MIRSVGFIPARGGSKGVPRKNIRALGGEPLICHTIRAALSSRFAAPVFVSTEDAEIAAISRAAGAIIIERPAGLAADDTPTLPVILHALPQIEAALGSTIEILVLLQATTPFRNADDIDRTVSLLDDTAADSAVSVVEAGHFHPQKFKRLEDGKLAPFFMPEIEGASRQSLSAACIRNGGIYATRRRTLLDKSSLYGDDCRAYVMPAERSVEIDTELDFAFAEFLLGRQQ
jgi:CMP-N-acetylneuraminic acid synthetase